MNASSSPAATMSPRFFPSGTCSRRTSGGSVTSTSFTLAPSPPSNHRTSLGATQVLGLADASLVADEDGRVAEHLRGKRGDRYDRLAATAPDGVGRERELARVELEEAAHAIEDFLGAQRQDVEVDALRANEPGLEGAGAVVITDGEREIECAHRWPSP